MIYQLNRELENRLRWQSNFLNQNVPEYLKRFYIILNDISKVHNQAKCTPLNSFHSSVLYMCKGPRQINSLLLFSIDTETVRGSPKHYFQVNRFQLLLNVSTKIIHEIKAVFNNKKKTPKIKIRRFLKRKKCERKLTCSQVEGLK